MSLDRHKRGIVHLVNEQLGTLHGHKDHGDRPLHHEKSVNDLDELQLRKTSSFQQCEPQAAISPRAATVGARMSSPRRHL